MRTRLSRGARHLVLASAMAVGLAACVQDELDSTMYLDRDGGVTWIALARDVRRPDPGALAEAVSEARAGRHPAVTVFQRLGATQATSRVLRGRAPAMFLVEARFDRFGALWDGVCEQLGGWPDSSLRSEGTRVTWTWTCAEGQAQPPAAELGDARLDDTLLALLDHVEVVLEEGRFASASGFVISEDGRKASLRGDRSEGDAHAPPGQADGSLVLALAWDPAAAR